ncbi:MAG: thioredoxin domain-containing protein [Candidatus Pacebacteria bacterium]|nr:thioredoxin domain-containing protein [Candidatus Paceibacterota bacterium]
METYNLEELNEEKDLVNVSNEKEIKKGSKKTIRGIDSNVILILFGLIIGIIISGSFGIDIFGKNDNILDIKKNVLENNGKTWVAYEDPIVTVNVISDENCENCEFESVLEIIKTIVPTMDNVNINFDSEEGKRLIESFEVKTIPAFVFSSNVSEIKEYDKIGDVLIENESGYLLDAVKTGIPIGRNLSAPKAQDDDATKGSVDAKVTIVKFSDFECSYCKEVENVLDEVLGGYPEQVKLVYKHFPLPPSEHANAQKAAEASECAKDQGKFWEMHDLMFADQSKLTVLDLKNISKTLKLNVTEFNECLDSDKYAQKIYDDIDTGLNYGVRGTPAFFINEQFLSGVISIEELKNIIDNELTK